MMMTYTLNYRNPNFNRKPVFIIIIIIGFSVYLHNSPGDITQLNDKSMQKTEKFWAVV